jgi:hypothetical protein
MGQIRASMMISRPSHLSRRASPLHLLAALPLALLSPLLTAATSPPALAQEPESRQSLRAINLARTYVVKLNGGLGVYRPAQCMFQTPTPANPCVVSSDEPGYRFHFVGGPPAWQQTNQMPTRETEILISPEGRQVEQLIYDGDLRPAARAISLARTEAVTLNGGPQAYEPARCMNAPAATTANPCLVAQDGSGFRFRFLGGTPDWQADDRSPSRETEILVSADGSAVVQVIHNGEPR